MWLFPFLLKRAAVPLQPRHLERQRLEQFGPLILHPIRSQIFDPLVDRRRVEYLDDVGIVVAFASFSTPTAERLLIRPAVSISKFICASRGLRARSVKIFKTG